MKEFSEASMDYQEFTNDALVMMYEATRAAVVADDILRERGMEPRFLVRETPAWRLHAADLEVEMLRRGITFEIVDWDGSNLPFEQAPALPAESRPEVEPSPAQKVLAALNTNDFTKD
jgi:hypothetical protein